MIKKFFFAVLLAAPIYMYGATNGPLSKSIKKQYKQEIRRLEKQKKSGRGLSASEELKLKELRQALAPTIAKPQPIPPKEAMPKYLDN